MQEQISIILEIIKSSKKDKTKNKWEDLANLTKKEIGDMYFYVEEIRTRRKKLALKTLYKKPIKVKL